MLIDIQGDADLPLIARSLKQMRKLGENVYKARGTQDDIKAARLLGSKMSYELPGTLLERLGTMTFEKFAEQSAALPDTDIHTFLKNEQENALLKSLERIKTSTYIESDLRTEDAITSWWEQERGAILSSLVNPDFSLDTQCDNEQFNIVHSETVFDDFGQPQSSFSLEELCYSRQLLTFIRRSATLSVDDPLTKNGEDADHLLSSFIENNQLNKYLTTETPRSHLRQLCQSVTHHDQLDLFSCLSQAVIDNDLVNQTNRDCHSHITMQSKKMSEIAEVWTFFKQLTNEDTFRELQAAFPAPASCGLNASPRTVAARTSLRLQKVLVAAALNHLNTVFITYMHVVVASQPMVAKLGGRPGTRALVRAFISVRFPWTNTSASIPNMHDNTMVSDDTNGQEKFEFENGSVDMKPVWMMIYYCLRIGDFNAATEIAKAAESNLGDFHLTLSEFSKHNCLSPDLLLNVKDHYRRVVKNSTDHYKRCVYCLLCRCDLANVQEEVASSLDDFLWLRLSQLDFDVSDSKINLTGTKNNLYSTENLTLAQLQTQLSEVYGESHFDAVNQPLMYFKLLCLTQQFEAALGFLARFEALRCHAVHIALALADINLLMLSPTVEAPLVTRVDCDPPGLRRLNLARLVLLYTRKFELTNPCEALTYYHFLSGVRLASSAGTYGDDVGEGARAEGCLRGGLLYLLDHRAAAAAMSRRRPPEAASRALTDTAGPSLFALCTCELALVTKEFHTLFGYLDESGKRKPGAVDRFCVGDEAREQLIGFAAAAVEARGELVDAVRLYQLAAAAAMETATVADASNEAIDGGSIRGKRHLAAATRLVNQLLVHAITTGAGGSLAGSGALFGSLVTPPDSERNTVVQLATELAYRLRDYTSGQAASWTFVGRGTTGREGLGDASGESSDADSAALFYLLDLTAFFELASEQRWAAALEHMDRLGLLPADAAPRCVDACLTVFSRLPLPVRRTLATVLLCMMRCLVGRAHTARAGTPADFPMDAPMGSTVVSPANTNTITELRSRAKALIAYTGRIPYRMPGELYAKLTEMEMELL